MRNKKILYLLIPLIILVLALIAGFVSLKLNSSPEKIFKHSISRAFELFESPKKQTTIKGAINLKASVESDNEQMQEINTILNGTNINFNMEIDMDNMIVNEKIDATLNNENLLNANILLQDQKGYVYLKDYLDKYLEIPQEDMEYSDLTEFYDKIESLDQNKLIATIKEELIKSLSSREFTKEKIQKVKVSKLDLTQQEFYLLSKEILESLKQNENFNNALGECKDDVIVALDDMIADFIELEYDESSRVVISIYTKGLWNKFVGFSIELKDDEDITLGMMLASREKASELVVYEQYGDEKEEYIKIRIENRKENKNKGTATIAITFNEEQYVVIYNYEKQGNQTTFTTTTEVEGVGLSVSGNTTEEGNNVKGKFIIAVQEETIGKANLSCTYDFTYGVEVPKTDVGNAVSINSLSEDERSTFLNNFANSKLYEILSAMNQLGTEGDATISNNYCTVSYNVPAEFELFEDTSSEEKMYMDENYNSIYLSIKKYSSASKYINDLEETYILSSSFYENQQISDVRTYKVNGKDYKIRTITYNDEYKTYVDLYFAYELNNEYCYVVQVSSESGNLSLESINKFLDIDVE